MTNRLVHYLIPVLLSGCASSGIINQPPIPNTQAASANIRIHKDVADGLLHDLTFTINDEPIYRFGDTNDFTFVMDPGEYLFGYRRGGKRCSTVVDIDAGGFYVFDLKPDCVIELEKE